MFPWKLQEICHEVGLWTPLKQKKNYSLFALSHLTRRKNCPFSKHSPNKSLSDTTSGFSEKHLLKVSTAGFSEVVGTDPVFSHSPRELWLFCPYLSSDFHLFLCTTLYFYINCYITCISQATCFLLHCLPKWTLPQLSISCRSMSPGEQRAFWGNFHKSKRH